MSGISTRIDKGTTRFAPKLKARPNRGKAAIVSEDGTPAATPSIDGSDTGSFGASLTESDTGSTSTNNNNNTSTLSTVPEKSTVATTSRRLSTATPMSPPSSHIRVINTPKSSVFSPTKISKPAQDIQTPSSSSSASASASHTSKPAAIAIIPGSTSSTSVTKPPTVRSGASVISLPSIRGRAESEDISGEDEEDDNDGFSPPKKKAKAKYVRPKNNRFGGGGAAAEEPQLTEDGEEIVPDYSDTPMYEFVKDMGTGRRSKIFLEHQKIMDEKRRVKRQEKINREIRIAEGRDASETPAPVGEEEDEYPEGEDDYTSVKKDEKDKQRAKSETVTPKALPVKTFAPQVRVVDGRIELDMDSLTVDHAVVDAADHLEPLEYVDESAATRFTNSASYSKKNKSEKWSEEDTELFFEALSQWGTDFGIICKIFPKKSRIAIRNKFKREDRINHARVEQALNKKTPIDLESYSQMTNTSFPEVDGLGLVKKPEGEDEPLFDPAFDDEYGDEYADEEMEPQEEIVEGDGGEEIVGSI
ncbi:Transcription factor TFIIIB component B [Linnemannia schmuckeri]|uniref:Transcription factor TFIIIB component B n=1 Tax=Linnemannia schmuckeri TaxID=64567 RepID=A0A9P5RQG6_9FUNG|nr:Transcription factor TFIIIB component B [Linnemannia schmuckeri]